MHGITSTSASSSCLVVLQAVPRLGKTERGCVLLSCSPKSRIQSECASSLSPMSGFPSSGNHGTMQGEKRRGASI